MSSLDVTLNLRNRTQQCRKEPKDGLKYINVLSNHPAHSNMDQSICIQATRNCNKIHPAGKFAFN